MYGSPVIRKPYLYGASTRARAARARATASACALRTIRGPLRYAVQVAIALLAAWFEYGTWLRHAHACSWPSASAADDFRVLVVADPQLLDMRSYPGRSFLLRALGLVVTDAYARKSWKAVTRALSSSKGPGIDGVVFLGDLLDSGIDSMDSNECVALPLAAGCLMANDDGAGTRTMCIASTCCSLCHERGAPPTRHSRRPCRR